MISISYIAFLPNIENFPFDIQTVPLRLEFTSASAGKDRVRYNIHVNKKWDVMFRLDAKKPDFGNLGDFSVAVGSLKFPTLEQASVVLTSGEHTAPCFLALICEIPLYLLPPAIKRIHSHDKKYLILLKHNTCMQLTRVRIRYALVIHEFITCAQHTTSNKKHMCAYMNIHVSLHMYLWYP